MSVYLMVMCCSFWASALSLGSILSLRKDMTGFLHSGKRSRQKTFSSGLWIFDFEMCSTRISHLNWKSTAEARVSRESMWLFSDLGTCLKSQQENLSFQAVTTFKYVAIWLSLVVYSPLTWLTISSKLHRTSSSVTPRVVTILRHVMTASYSASLLVA